ncbi:hypothetical protein B0H11DRAFT_1915977 [Mycena galericulata]|nr:hypothetical protein B0H11DRAFT_1927792 [Mycena galericulata]KAJ7480233.1 hypothetical protein B0H11DRAFT_1915977 [Mycena galericulata]
MFGPVSVDVRKFSIRLVTGGTTTCRKGVCSRLVKGRVSEHLNLFIYFMENLVVPFTVFLGAFTYGLIGSNGHLLTTGCLASMIWFTIGLETNICRSILVITFRLQAVAQEYILDKLELSGSSSISWARPSLFALQQGRKYGLKFFNVPFNLLS